MRERLTFYPALSDYLRQQKRIFSQAM